MVETSYAIKGDINGIGTGKRKKLIFFYFYHGELQFETPLHIGSSDIAIETDAPLLRDAGGRFYLPGTSVVGPLRAKAYELFDKQNALIEQLFGCQQGNTGIMSRLLIEDAYPKDKFQHTTIRDGVAIDRKLESAYPGAKYDMEIAPTGLRFDLKLRLELRDGDAADNMRFILEEALREFKAGKIKIGGSKTRGLGRCKFDWKVRVLDFDAKEVLINYLIDKDVECLPETEKAQSDEIKPENIDEKEIRLLLKVEKSPFLIKNGREDSDYDAVFTKVFNINGDEVDYIPGSSIKGVFRSRAEKIMRTLGRDDICMTAGEESCTARIEKCKDDLSKKCKERFGEILEMSCPVCRLFGNGYLAGRISFDDAFFNDALRKKKYDSVAIDRFTGGGAHGKLFNAYPAVEGETEVRIQIKKPSNLDKALISFLLRDLVEGFPPLRFGYGKSKGYGLLKCTQINGIKTEEDAVSGLFEPKPVFSGWWEEKTDG